VNEVIVERKVEKMSVLREFDEIQFKATESRVTERIEVIMVLPKTH